MPTKRKISHSLCKLGDREAKGTEYIFNRKRLLTTYMVKVEKLKQKESSVIDAN